MHLQVKQLNPYIKQMQVFFTIANIPKLNLITTLRCMESFRLQKYLEIAQSKKREIAGK